MKQAPRQITVPKNKTVWSISAMPFGILAALQHACQQACVKNRKIAPPKEKPPQGTATAKCGMEKPPELEGELPLGQL
jgi:hypothetical protein